MRLTLLTIPILLAFEASASNLSFNTFGKIACVGFEQNIHITQAGHNRGNFFGERRSFEYLASDGKCRLIAYTGDNQSGSSVDFGLTGTGSKGCRQAADQRAFRSFDVFCL
ncbi:hypothetical protein M501DRAFT_1061360 [Patellaria atrata CBS 101060]|uniref:Uncharacterized protein n=1 Tax=Patellaria atrata CBS 101060 TaxID=1346257 RepID=A0A9P4S4G5_9PEZI|nr:hypothetical protein M501DRAFT_1061360 [Patellaria atrata CBS 101060]